MERFFTRLVSIGMVPAFFLLCLMLLSGDPFNPYSIFTLQKTWPLSFFSPITFFNRMLDKPLIGGFADQQLAYATIFSYWACFTCVWSVMCTYTWGRYWKKKWEVLCDGLPLTETDLDDMRFGFMPKSNAYRYLKKQYEEKTGIRTNFQYLFYYITGLFKTSLIAIIKGTAINALLFYFAMLLFAFVYGLASMALMAALFFICKVARITVDIDPRVIIFYLLPAILLYMAISNGEYGPVEITDQELANEFQKLSQQ